MGNGAKLAMMSFRRGEARGEMEGGELPRKPVTTVATEAMAIVETLKGEDMSRLIVGFLLVFIASSIF